MSSEEIICPITLQPIVVPCLLQEAGIVYFFEFIALRKWLKESRTNPLTGLPLLPSATFELSEKHFRRHFHQPCPLWKEAATRLLSEEYAPVDLNYFFVDQDYQERFFQSWKERVPALNTPVVQQVLSLNINHQAIAWNEGRRGARGARGARGVQGISSARGVQGISGARGVQGISGARGVQGISSARGVQGISGARGARGVQGISSARGVQGISGARVPIGTHLVHISIS